MSVSRNYVKDLLISKNRGRLGRNSINGQPTIGEIPLSPLLTNFEKWSGKRQKLYFKNEDCMISKGLKTFHLETNIFASLLASPMRCDRITRHRLPKDLLLQLKLEKIQKPPNTTQSLQLTPEAVHTKLKKSSYVINSRDILTKQIKSSTSWIPIPALLSGMRYFDTSEVLIDKDHMLTHYQDELRRQLETKLAQSRGHGTETMLERWNILVTYVDKYSFPTKVAKLRLSDGALGEVVLFNLKCLESNLPMRSIIEANKNHELGLVLKFPKDNEVVKLLYRLLTFYQM